MYTQSVNSCGKSQIQKNVLTLKMQKNEFLVIQLSLFLCELCMLFSLNLEHIKKQIHRHLYLCSWIID